MPKSSYEQSNAKIRSSVYIVRINCTIFLAISNNFHYGFLQPDQKPSSPPPPNNLTMKLLGLTRMSRLDLEGWCLLPHITYIDGFFKGVQYYLQSYIPNY